MIDQSEEIEKVYCFGDYRLSPRRYLLLRGNAPVRIGTRALDLLRLLVENAGRLVSKEELIGFAWPDTIVHESNLKVNIGALRRALPHARPEFPYIATVPGRGYRFVAPVTIEADASLSEASAPTIPQVDNLPPPHAIVGREDVIAGLAEMLTTTGFLTIVGPAGVGKTTVAVAVARLVASRYADGATFVDFSTISDARLVGPAIASSLGTGGNLNDMVAGIVESLRGRRKLLVLDNCEHVLNAACLFADQIRAELPDVGLLTTSREPLGSRFESVRRLPPLRCPQTGSTLDRSEALSFSAVQLFVARAQEASGYELSEADAPIVCDICRRLDGIALAIELAASQLASHEPAKLLGLLDQSFEVLNYGPRSAPSRHQALLATLEWSYRLLSDQEARVLHLLSVFAGGFALEDAVAVGGHEGVSAEEIGRCVGNLATKSLISSNFVDGLLQYRLLDATRSYANDRLRYAGELGRACASHAQFLLQVFERAEQEWHWQVGEEWTACYGPRTSDLRKAIDWALGEQGVAEIGLRLTAAAIPLWDELSLVGESRLRVYKALTIAQSTGTFDPALHMKLATAYAWALTFSDRLDGEADNAWLESLRLAQATGSVDYQLRALWGLAVLRSFTGRHRLALASLGQFEAIAAQENDRAAAPDGERLRLMTAFYCGDIQTAYDGLKTLAERHDQISHRTRMARFQLDRYVAIRNSLAIAAWVRGEQAQALDYAAASVAGAVAIKHLVSHSNALALAALPITLWGEDLDAAEVYVAALVDNLTHRAIGIWGAVCRFFAAAIAHGRGDPHGVEAMRIALDDLVASNFLVRVPLYQARLAEAAMKEGRLELARASIDDAMKRAERQEEAWCIPEILRVLGLVQWTDGQPGLAGQTLLRAVTIAADIGVRAFELRAAASLGALTLESGDVSRAIAALDAACARFDADVVTPDLERARDLLARLRALEVFQAAPEDASSLENLATAPQERGSARSAND